MSFFKNLFHAKKKTESVVCVDISAESVAGAYVHYKEGELPTLLYARRLPIEAHKNESHERALFRALKILGDDLIREGAPLLLRAAGSGRADTILVSVDAPWQETTVRTENFERTKPFEFTKNMVATALEKTSTAIAGKRRVDESVVSTVLNGYETREPWGRKVHRASVRVLSSFVDESVAEVVTATLRDLFHTRRILFIAGSSLRHQAVRVVFPHERDALVLNTNKRDISLTFKNPWSLESSPKSIPMLASHLTGLVRQTATTPPDLHLLLMALYLGSVRRRLTDLHTACSSCF